MRAKPLDRARIEEAFRIMGQYLLDRKALGEIAIYGGRAILFRFDWRKSSQDVGVLSASWLDESVAITPARARDKSTAS